MNWLMDRIKDFGDKTFIIYDNYKISYINSYQDIFRYQNEFYNNDNQKYRIFKLSTNNCCDMIQDIMRLIYCYKTNIVLVAGSHDKNTFIKNIKYGDDYTKLVLFSSGTTGQQKCMIHNFDKLVDSYKDRKQRNLTMLQFLELDHIGGINTLFNAISSGMTLVIPESKDPQHICQLIQKYKVNILPTTPSFLRLMLMTVDFSKYDLSSLRLITYGTQRMSQQLLKELTKLFPRVKFQQTFGTSQTGILRMVSKSSDSTLMKFDQPNCQYKIVDNELWLRSKVQVNGYQNLDNDKFTQDGWFKTGDIVQQVDNQYFRIVGRIDQIINVGGLKVFPSQVESVIQGLDLIKDCMVYGKDNQILGQIVACDVVVKDQNIESVYLKSKIREYCKDKLEKYKIPIIINIVDQIKVNSRFKRINKNVSKV